MIFLLFVVAFCWAREANSQRNNSVTLETATTDS
jgi:hypothetical protein